MPTETLNRRATGEENQQLAADRLKEASKILEGMLGSAEQIAKYFGDNANYAKLFADTVKGTTVGIRDIAALTGATGKDLQNNLESKKKELDIQARLYRYTLESGNLDSEHAATIREQLRLNEQQVQAANAQLEIAKQLAQEDEERLKNSELLKENVDDVIKTFNAHDTKLQKSVKRLQGEQKAAQRNLSETQNRIKQTMVAENRTEMTQSEMDELGMAQQMAQGADFKAAMASNFSSALEGIADKMLSNLSKIEDSFFAKAESIFQQYKGSVNARLVGLEKGFGDIEGLISKNMIMYSSLVKTEDILKNVNEAVKAGIAYNIEERAFLQSVADNVAQTFDAFDSNLLRVIRLQQSDSSAARMGLARDLTKLFNQYFSDSSYMSDMYDTVMSELVEATSTMARNQSVEFEATAQKWLGALYSIGLSSSAVQSIASGINLLGSGNVEALAGNTPLQNLLAMSASRAGMDYGNLLISGFNGGSDLNDLMYSMVNYLAEIAQSTAENNVVRSAYGNVFNLSMSDWRAISNMGDTLSSIYSTNIDYGTSMASANAGLGEISRNIGMTSILNNMYENVMLNSALGVVKNPATYMMYKAVSGLEQLTGGISIPTISVMGNSVGLNTTIEQLAKTGIFGLSSAVSSIGQVFNLISNLGNMANGNLLGIWDGEETITRGVGENNTLSVTTGESYSAQIGNASSEDMESSLISNATKDAKRQDKIKSGKERKEDDKTFDDLYYALFAPEAEAVLSTAGTSLTNINTEITTLNEEVRKAMHENAFNVNVKSFGGINMQSGIPVYFSGDTNSSGVKQMDGFISKFIQAFGINTDNTQDLEAYTLQDLVNFFIDTVGAEEGTGLNVNLAGNEVSATSFLTGQSGFERY